MNLSDRVKNLMLKRGVSAYTLSNDTGISQATLSRILNKETKPNAGNLKLLSDYFHIDPIWLLTGEGNSENKAVDLSIQDKGVPYYDIDFTASFLEVENNQQMTPTSYISHPFFAGCDYVIRASGQSMAKVIAHGDAVGLIKIDNWREFFPFGEVYAIVTKNSLRTIKVITKGEDNDHYTLISKPTDSKKEEFPPQQIKIDSILHLFKVQASSHLF